MAKQSCDPFAHASAILPVVSRPGALLVSQNDKLEPNVMTIGWMNLGTIWAKPVCIVYVRPTRHTYNNIEATGEFTVNVPTAAMKEAINICGSVSGRHEDKFAKANLIKAPADKVKPPVLADAALHYECRVLHYNDLIPANLNATVKDSFYAGGDFHRCYFGEILSCMADLEAIKALSK